MALLNSAQKTFLKACKAFTNLTKALILQDKHYWNEVLCVKSTLTHREKTDHTAF